MQPIHILKENAANPPDSEECSRSPTITKRRYQNVSLLWDEHSHQ